MPVSSLRFWYWRLGQRFESGGRPANGVARRPLRLSRIPDFLAVPISAGGGRAEAHALTGARALA
jgi:hypothetical protein